MESETVKLALIGLCLLFVYPSWVLPILATFLIASFIVANLRKWGFFKLVRDMIDTFNYEFSKQETKPPAPDYSHIKDEYEAADDLRTAMRKQMIESTTLVMAVDFTKSNLDTGYVSFNKKSLHDITGPRNPYQHAIELVGKNILPMGDGNLICGIGFGDHRTKDTGVFDMATNNEINKNVRPTTMNNVQDMIAKYRWCANNVSLSGPTSFAPAIRATIEMYKTRPGYYMLILITDGATSDPKSDAKAIVEASNYPISIICIGVGDGPWKQMKEFDDELPARKFDNFQLVIYQELIQQPPEKMDEAFFLRAFMEVPKQYEFIEKEYLSRRRNGATNFF